MPPRFRQLTDKYAVRVHVANMVGEEYLTKLLWHGDDPCAIPFDRLPAAYVIKPSHAAGQVIIVKGQADRAEVVRTVSGWLASDYYWHGRETYDPEFWDLKLGEKWDLSLDRRTPPR